MRDKIHLDRQPTGVADSFKDWKAERPCHDDDKGVLKRRCLAMTYSRMLDAHYHWRRIVSLPSSGWDRVGPNRYGRQAKGEGEES